MENTIASHPVEQNISDNHIVCFQEQRIKISINGMVGKASGVDHFTVGLELTEGS